MIPLNHRNHIPGQDAVNGRPVITSRVLSWTEDGVITTMHTIYKPLTKEGIEDEEDVKVENKELSNEH